MSTQNRPPSTELAQTVRTSWSHFLDTYEPLRPELYRYCRYLTRSPWDAEELVQDTLARAFVTLGRTGSAPPNPRAWLLRVASNSWLDRTRRLREEPGAVPETASAQEPRAAREAAGTLLVRLSPQERAAVVLKDVFELTLEEVAEALSTSVGAIKAALHRGRARMLEPEPEQTERRTPAAGVLDAFRDAFNARDLERLTALLLDNASIEVVGITTEYVHDAARSNVFHGMMYGSERMAQADTRGGMEARFIQGVLPTPPRCERRVLRGEPLLLLWYAHSDGEAVRAINRIETGDSRVSRVQNYFFTPDLIADVCRELEVPYRVNGYRSCLSSGEG
ncbi:RNA polymerase sigma factor [Archangium sp.]|uniref:RNA polymerase sigma factor n=1 Tax=Archangium sp. TaxID=1872627 RepID=UPI00389A2545